jgi:hypothetical protein
MILSWYLVIQFNSIQFVQFNYVCFCVRVCITCYRLDNWGITVWFPAQGKRFFSSKSVHNGSGAHPWGNFLQRKGAGCDTDQSPPSSAEIKNEWICTSTPHIYDPMTHRGMTLPSTFILCLLLSKNDLILYYVICDCNLLVIFNLCTVGQKI